MKAVVLAAGRGRRMRGSLGDEVESKFLARIGDRPLLHYGLDNAARASVTEIVIVVGHDAAAIDRACGSHWDQISIKLVEQAEPLGIVHAIECARDAIGNSDFLLFLGDEFVIGGRHHEIRSELERGEVDAICGIVEGFSEQELAGNYALFADPKTARIERLVEKPKVELAQSPHTVFMGTGNCAISNRILDYTDRTMAHPLSGQRELSDWLQTAIDDGCSVSVQPIARGYVNVNTRYDLTRARALQAEMEAKDEAGSRHVDVDRHTRLQ